MESSLSSFRDGSYSVTSQAEWDGTTYDFGKLSGTSMSSPATAGVVALMLEANPTLSAEDVKTILEWTAREDNDTGSLPAEGDLVWGHGKVTASQAVMSALGWISHVGLPYFPSAPDERVFLSKPQTSSGSRHGLPSGTWTMMNGQGAVVQSGELLPGSNSTWDLPAAYVLQTTSREGATRTARVVKALRKGHASGGRPQLAPNILSKPSKSETPTTSPLRSPDKPLG